MPDHSKPKGGKEQEFVLPPVTPLPLSAPTWMQPWQPHACHWAHALPHHNTSL